MGSITSVNKLVRLVIVILGLLLVVAVWWIVDQKNDIQKMREGYFTTNIGIVQELIMDIDSYSKNYDPVLLGQIHVRFRYLEEQTIRTITYRNESIQSAHPTTPSGTTWQMMHSNIRPETIATHLQRYKELLVHYQDRKVVYTEVDRNEKDLIELWMKLREATHLTSRELSSDKK